jgi:hypothetical protein
MNKLDKDYHSNESIFNRWLTVLPTINIQTAIKCEKICRNILESRVDEKIGVSQLLTTINKNE